MSMDFHSLLDASFGYFMEVPNMFAASLRMDGHQLLSCASKSKIRRNCSNRHLEEHQR